MLSSRRGVIHLFLASRVSAALGQPTDKDIRAALSVTEKLMHATTRIECINANGAVSFGTGFFYKLFVSGDQYVPVIVTNKHVLDGNLKARLVMTMSKDDGSPDIGKLQRVEIFDLQGQWLGHSDPKVDLAILPIGNIVGALSNRGTIPFLVFIDQSIIPDSDMLKSLTPVEDVLVVGYPDGIWDSHNNSPVFRRGITATPPYLNFNGESEFLIDCSIFPGSSGSPVFLHNSGSYATRNGGLAVGGRTYFLGVVYAVALHAVTGELRIVPAPTNTRTLSISAIPNNLGLCVMASRVLDFEPILARAGKVSVPTGYKMRSTLP